MVSDKKYKETKKIFVEEKRPFSKLYTYLFLFSFYLEQTLSCITNNEHNKKKLAFDPIWFPHCPACMCTISLIVNNWLLLFLTNYWGCGVSEHYIVCCQKTRGSWFIEQFAWVADNVRLGTTKTYGSTTGHRKVEYTEY